MTEQKIDVILRELSELKTLVVTELKQLKTEVAELKAGLIRLENRVENRLNIIDIRLSLIEQRLGNIKPWISVNNKHLHFNNTKQTAA